MNRIGLLLGVVCAVGCGGGARGGSADDPHHPGLAFDRVPTSAHLNGLFQVWIRINDVNGGRVDGDSTTMVTLRASGGGHLGGTLTRRAIEGVAIFDDLRYDRWEPITLVASAASYGEVATRAPVEVRPLLRFVRAPAPHVPVNMPAGPFEIELVDGEGTRVGVDQSVALEAAGARVSVAGGPERSLADGHAIFDQVTLLAAGSRTLLWRSPRVSDLVFGVTVHEQRETDALWLPAARAGVHYVASLPPGASSYTVVKGALPRGLALRPSGDLEGVPVEPAHAQLEILGARASGDVLWLADLSVFPATDAVVPIDGFDAAGPFAVATREESVEVRSRRVTAPVRLYYPDAGGAVADGAFPLVVFHHGALPWDPQRPHAYDRYDPLLVRWASYGFVVASVDAPDLVWNDGRLVSATLSNIDAMSEDQRATIDAIRTRNADPAWPLAGHVTTDRVLVAGHSRGGAAALITARAEPSVVGGILLEPLDPMATVGGEPTWSGPLPPKPFLTIIAGNDADLPYPMVDFLYERRAAPMVAATILGSIHDFTCADCPPEDGAHPEIQRPQDWAVSNAFAVAFLRWVSAGDLHAGQALFGPGALSSRLSDLGTLVRADVAGRALLVDDFQGDQPGRNRLGGDDTCDRMLRSEDEPSLLNALERLPSGYEPYAILYGRPEHLATAVAHRLAWAEDGALFTAHLGDADVRGRAAFVFRARTDDAPLSPDQVSVRVVDTEAHAGAVAVAGHTGDRALGARFSDVRIPLATPQLADVDLGHLDRVELVFRGAGSVLIDDLRFE